MPLHRVEQRAADLTAAVLVVDDLAIGAVMPDMNILRAGNLAQHSKCLHPIGIGLPGGQGDQWSNRG